MKKICQKVSVSVAEKQSMKLWIFIIVEELS